MRRWAIPKIILEERRSLLDAYEKLYPESETDDDDDFPGDRIFEYCYMYGSDLYREYDAYMSVSGDEGQLQDRFGTSLNSHYGWWVQDFTIDADGKVYRDNDSEYEEERTPRILKPVRQQYCYPDGTPIRFVQVSDPLREIIAKAEWEIGTKISSQTKLWRHRLYTEEKPVEFPPIDPVQRYILQILFHDPDYSVGREDLYDRMDGSWDYWKDHPIVGIVEKAVASLNMLDEDRDLIRIDDRALTMTPRGWQEYLELDRFPYMPTYYYRWWNPNNHGTVYSPEFLEFVEREGRALEERLSRG